MAYSLQLNQDRVVRFLRDFEGLSREERIRLFANLHGDLAVNADHYRADASRRLAPGSSCFWYRVVLRRQEASGPARVFWFAVDDSAAPHGVLQVEYVQVTEWRL